jgi:acetyltransferase-like isoleucine patch superfamily enzyme
LYNVVVAREPFAVMPQFDYSSLKSVGNDVVISPNAEIRRPNLVSIGSHVAIDTAWITTAAEIKDYVHIGPYVSIIGGAKGLFVIGNFSNLAAGCRVVCVSDRQQGEGLTGPASIPARYQDAVHAAPVIVENFVAVGTNAVVLPGVTLAEGCVIGACALVTKSTEPWTVYAGVPAQPRKQRPREKMIQYAAELGYVSGAAR